MIFPVQFSKEVTRIKYVKQEELCSSEFVSLLELVKPHN
jgi:hypothetical protein